VRPLWRTVGDGGRDHPPGAGGPPDRRPSDRVLADEPGIEGSLLPFVREQGIAVTAYGVLSRGLLSPATARLAGPADPRIRFPRFREQNLAQNLGLVAALEQIGAERGATAAQLAIAWVLTRGSDIIPLIGTKR